MGMQAFGALLGGIALIGSQGSARAIDLFDERDVRERGFDIIYEARELELPQSVRDGLEQVGTPELESAVKAGTSRGLVAELVSPPPLFS